MRSVEILKIPASRRFVTEALEVGRGAVAIHGLVEVDFTEARRRLEATDPPLSVTALIVAAVGRAAALHPKVHAYRDWRGRLVLHRHVDIATLFEVTAPDGSRFPLGHLMRNAESRSIADISDEIRAVADEPTASPSGRLLGSRAAKVAAVPGLVGLAYRLVSRSIKLREQTGTVAVTSVGMFGGGGGGFGIAALTVPSLGIVVGGISTKPRVIDDRIVAREVLDLTITVDHRIIDGAPASRFAADLRRIIETADLP